MAPSATATRARSSGDVARQLTDVRRRLHGEGIVVGPAQLTEHDLEAGLEMIDRALEAVLAAIPGAAAARRARLARITVDLHDARRSIRAVRMQGRGRPIASISQSIGRLRRARTTSGMLDRVCAEAAEACGLSRVFLSVFRSTEWTVRGAFPATEPTSDPISPWKDGLTEWMAFESGAATIVGPRTGRAGEERVGEERAGEERAATPEPAGSYVVVPVVVSSGVIGLLRGDHHPGDRLVDEVDLELLSAFASAFGDVYERSALQERLERQRRALVAAFEAEIDAADRLVDDDFDLSDVERDDLLPRDAAEHTAIDDLLTPREREVVSLIVAGASNSDIGERLVISTGTVKSHVKRILRKLGAANRSEAISRYLELRRGGA